MCSRAPDRDASVFMNLLILTFLIVFIEFIVYTAIEIVLSN